MPADTEHVPWDNKVPLQEQNDEPIKPQEWLMMKRGLVVTARKRAKKKGIACTITADDISWPKDGLCPILGVPLKKHRGKMERSTPSLDRKDNSLGYVKGNVFVISWFANYVKSELTKEQLVSLAKYANNEL